MKKANIFIRLVLLLMASLFIFGACTATYKDDVLSEDLTNLAPAPAENEEQYKAYGEEFLQFYLPSVMSQIDHYSIVYAPAADDYTEFGVFHVGNPDDVEKVEQAVSDYLSYFRTTYEPQAQQYDPTEQQKLKDASYAVYGNYVIYSIQTADVITEWQTAVQQKLK